MKIRISNMLRVERAEIALERGAITTVAGRNASGKTSLATIAGALFAADGNPVGASKGQGKVYLRDGADAGVAELLDPNDGIMVRWLAQSGELASLYEGESGSSPAGVGLIDFCAAMSPAARVGLWETYFLPPPEVLEARIRKALEPYVNKTLLEELMEHSREDKGFDGIVKAYQARARDAKRSWTRITGEEWGIKKAGDWLPDGWLADLDGTTLEAADKVVDEAKHVVQSGQIAHAVDASLIAQAEEAKAKVPAAQSAVNVADRAVGEARLALQNAVDAHAPTIEKLETLERDMAALRIERREVDSALQSHRINRPAVPDGDVPVSSNESLAWEGRITQHEAREPQKASFVTGVTERRERIEHLVDNPPVPERAPKAVYCPSCNAELLPEDHFQKLVPFDREAAQAEAYKRHEVAVIAQGDEIERLEGEIVERLDEAEQAYENAMAQWREQRDEMKRYQEEAEKHALELLHASAEQWLTDEAALELKLSDINQREQLTIEERSPLREAREAHETNEGVLHAELNVALGKLNDAQVDLLALKREAGKGEGKVARTEEMMDAQAAAERELERAEQHKRLVTRRFDAREQHENIVAYQTIAKLLGPKGVRAQAVEEAMAQFDGVLNTIAKVTGWPRVRLDRHYAVSIGDRKILRLCAESERLRAQWCLQIAIVRVRREPIAILDAAGHLDNENLTGLGKLLGALCSRPSPPAFLVCGTELDHEVINPTGRNYALVDGVTKEMQRP